MRKTILLLPMLLAGQVRIPGPGGPVPVANGGGGGNGPALVSSVCGPASPGSGGGASVAINTTGANFLVIFLGSNQNSPTVSDSNSNLWNSLTGAYSGPYVNIYYSQNPVVGSGHTFTVSGGNQYPGFCVMAFSGMATSGAYENGTWNNDSYAPTVQPGSVTPTFTGHNLFVTGISGNNTGTAVNSGFSAPIDIPYSSGSSYGASMSYLVQSGTASQDPIWTLNPGSYSSNAVIAVFQGAN